MIEKLRPHIDKYLAEHDRLVIAIEGSAAAGKSSLAEALQAYYNASVIHMDHFFLPLDMRSEKRLSEAGGNVHYERFIEEVVQGLSAIKAGDKEALEDSMLNYRTFDCSVMDYGAEQSLELTPLIIVEGVYSQHPKFGAYADLKVFIEMDEETQRKRIKLRENSEKQTRFFNEWIPMEKEYFAKYGI